MCVIPPFAAYYHIYFTLANINVNMGSEEGGEIGFY